MPGRAHEIAACRPWLDAELRLIQPQVIVCLGAIAAQTLLGRTFRITERRGEVVERTARNRRGNLPSGGRAASP